MLNCSHWSFGAFLISGIRSPSLTLYIVCTKPEISHFSKKHCFLLLGNLETKIWFQCKLIVIGMSLLLDQRSEQHYEIEGPASWASYQYSHTGTHAQKGRVLGI